MKKILLIVAFILILVAIPVTLLVVKQRQEIRQRAVPATTLQLEPSSKTVQVGDTFTLDVVLDTQNQNQAAGAEINLTYNPLYLEGVSFLKGDFMSYVWVEGQVGNGTASIIVGSTAPEGQGGGVTGRGTIAVLTLRALQPTGTTPTIINFASTTQVSGANPADKGSNILVGNTPAQITVGGEGAPSPSPTPNTSPSPGGPTPSPSPAPSASPGQVTKITQPTNGATVTSKRPLIKGTSFTDADMLLSINANPIYTGTFSADSSGNWQHTPTIDLANGTYIVTVTGSKGTDEEDATATFTVSVGGSGGTGIASPTPSPSPSTSTSPGVSASPGASGTGTEEEIPVTGNEMPTVIMLGTALILILIGSKALLFP